MKTCKDCIHYDVCHTITPIATEATGICKLFKDKSLVYDLPCKVGDMVYFANEDYHRSAEIDGIHIDEQGVSFTWVQYEVGVDIVELWDEGDFNIDDIGKTVFLTMASISKDSEKCKKCVRYSECDSKTMEACAGYDGKTRLQEHKNC